MDVKVGDKVRSLVTEFDVRKGCIYTVSQVGDGDIWVFDDVDAEYFLLSNEYEPVAVADSNGNQHSNQPKFKVGDRVRMIKDGLSTTGAVGKLATIDSWNGALQSESGQYLLKIDPPIDYKTLAVTKEYTRATPDCFELVDAPLTIQAGRYYRTRDGRKVGPMEHSDHSWIDLRGRKSAFNCGTSGDYDAAGVWLTSDGDSPKDIIAEWTDEPVAAGDSSNDYAYGISHATTGFTVPLDAPEFGGAELDDDDIVEMSIGELTGAIADALRVVGKKTDKPKPLKAGDDVTLALPARITGFDKHNVNIVLATGGSYALPLAALRAA